jgi:hypothetical protein
MARPEDGHRTPPLMEMWLRRRYDVVIVARYQNRQRRAGTRRVQQREHTRVLAGTADTPPTRDLQDKRDPQ